MQRLRLSLAKSDSFWELAINRSGSVRCVDFLVVSSLFHKMEPVLWQIKSVKRQQGLEKQMRIKVTSLHFMGKRQAGAAERKKKNCSLSEVLMMLAQGKFSTDNIRDAKLVLCVILGFLPCRISNW